MLYRESGSEPGMVRARCKYGQQKITLEFLFRRAAPGRIRRYPPLQGTYIGSNMPVSCNRWLSEVIYLRPFTGRRFLCFLTNIFMLKIKQEEMLVYQKVDTNLNLVDREKKEEKFWKENNIFEKRI